MPRAMQCLHWATCFEPSGPVVIGMSELESSMSDHLALSGQLRATKIRAYHQGVDHLEGRAEHIGLYERDKHHNLWMR